MKVIDLTGKKIGQLTVVERAGSRRKQKLWKCLCDCGNTVYVITTNLHREKTLSCGCRRSHHRALDLTDRRFGRLTVVKFVGRINRNRLWLARCDCGTELVIRRDSLTLGKTQSCGCQGRENRLLSNERRRRDLVGLRFGRLVVTAPAEPIYLPYLKGKRMRPYRQWYAKCDCGKTRTVRQTSLVCGNVRSCGCLLADVCTENGYRMKYRDYPELIPAAKALNALKKEIATTHAKEPN